MLLQTDTVKQFGLSCLLLLALLIPATCLYAQKNVADSLKTELIKKEDDSSKVDLLAKLSKYYRYVNSDSSIYYAKEGLTIARSINNLSLEASCLHHLTVSYWVMENYPFSVNCCIKAIRILEKLNDKKGLSKSYNMMGILYSSQQYDSLALQYYNKALSYAMETRDSGTLCRTLGNIGELVESQNKLDLALQYYNEALKVSTEINDKVNISTNLDYLGNISFKKGNYITAVEYYEKAIRLATEMNDKQNISNTANSLSNIYFITGKLEKCYYYADQSLRSAFSINYLSNIKESAMMLYKYYFTKKDYKRALEHYIIAANAGDSLSSSANEKEFRKIQQRYELDKKQKEILILSKDKKIAEKEARTRLLITVFLLIGAVLLAVFSFFIFRNYRNERKAKLLLASQKAEITEKNEELFSLNEEVTMQRDILAKQRKNTTDSIRYASRIQNAILPALETNRKYFPASFVYNRPKDIVGGDFFWFHCDKTKNSTGQEEIVYFAVADCTGHGIPGAFMSILCYNIIEIAMEENPQVGTDVLLTAISNMIDRKLRQHSDEKQIHDGIDIALCAYHRTTGMLEYSGIRNPMAIIRKNSINFYKPNKRTAADISEKNILYDRQAIPIEKGDLLYLFTDGYADQFNGENQKKFSMKRFKDLLLEISRLSPDQQYENFHKVFESWKGQNEQIDDVLVLGIAF